MTDQTGPSPDNVPAIGDPGDETARRYRYQWTFAAILCCMLLDEATEVTEIFCEHHEDILIKHLDATFSGLQIKTREANQSLWTATEKAVISSCARFAKLEADFPDKFRDFRFLTNHPLQAKKNGNDLKHVLQIIGTSDSFESLPTIANRFLRKVAKKAECSNDVAFSALRKTQASDELPKLSDVESKLVDTLVQDWSRANDCTYPLIKQAGLNLTYECGRASSLSHIDSLPAYLPATAEPEDEELAQRIEEKRMHRNRVLETLEFGLNTVAPLEGDPEAAVEPGIGSVELLRKKLDAGGLSAVTRTSAEDLRNKADYMGLTWISKHGRGQGLIRYGHIMSLVHSIAAEAFETAKRDDYLFGHDMLTEFRSLIQAKRNSGGQLYDCSDEHLMGFLYSLTSQCKVQMSNELPWEGK